MAHAMAVLEGEHRLAKAGMVQGMAQLRQLAVVQTFHPLHPLPQGPHLAGLALQVGMQAGDCLLDHLHLGQQEIGEVVVVLPNSVVLRFLFKSLQK